MRINDYKVVTLSYNYDMISIEHHVVTSKIIYVIIKDWKSFMFSKSTRNVILLIMRKDRNMLVGHVFRSYFYISFNFTVLYCNKPFGCSRKRRGRICKSAKIETSCPTVLKRYAHNLSKI